MHQQAQKAPCVQSHVLVLVLWITHGMVLRDKTVFLPALHCKSKPEPLRGDRGNEN